MAEFFPAMLIFALVLYGPNQLSPAHLSVLESKPFDLSVTLTPINDPEITGALPSAINWLTLGPHKKIMSPYYKPGNSSYLTILTLLLSGQIEKKTGPAPQVSLW